jgi:hypothetical protein
VDQTDFPFAAWYGSLSTQERARYARRAKTSSNYIESHLTAPYKVPRPQKMKHLASASGRFTVGELAASFYEAFLAREERRARAQ